MKERNSLNSAILKQQHPDIYQEFFSKCEVVVSCPHFFTWAGEYVGYWGGMMTLQKLPFRLYLGLETDLKSKKVSVAPDSQSFSLQKGKFQPDQYEHSAQARLLEFVNNFLKNSKIKHGFKIHLLSEIPFGGSGSAGALSSALSLALLSATGAIEPQQIKKWKTLSSEQLIKNKSFDEAFRLAWKIMAGYRRRETSGAAAFITLLPATSPVYYFLNPHKTQTIPLIINSNYSKIDKIKYQGGSINELFGIKGIPCWPIDFGLLYIGEPRGTTPYSIGQPKQDMKEVRAFAKKSFDKKFTEKTKGIWQANLKVMNFLSCQVLINLGKGVSQGPRDESLRKLFQSLDKHQALFLILGCLPKNIQTISSLMHQQVKKIDSLGVGVKPVSTTKKDIVLFAFPHGQTRQVLKDVIPKLEGMLGTPVCLGYASWLDGIEERGAVIEQALEHKKYSDFIAKQTIFVTEYNKTNAQKLLLTPQAFRERVKQIDLTLDQEKNRVYIKGKALTSKQLHSSKATVALLCKLLQSKKREVSNKDLDQSSYSEDRYELQGKLTQPLVKAFKKLTKTTLPLRVSGRVTDFKIKLEPSPIKIWLKER